MSNEEEQGRTNEEKDTAPQSEPVPASEPDAVEAAKAKPETVAAEPAPIQPMEQEEPALVRAAYEHPLAIRITHWVNAISLFVMVTSGLRIFRAFPSFGPKIPEKILLSIPKSITLGGWLGGALQWHFTFMWFFAASGAFYVVYQVISGHYRTMLFTPRDVPGVWPMARHYSQAPRDRSIQPAAKVGVHIHDRFRRVVAAHWDRPLQADAVFLAGVSVRRFSLDAGLAFCGDVRISRIYSRAPDHGSAARLVKFLLHAFRMETRARVSVVVNSAGVARRKEEKENLIYPPAR